MDNENVDKKVILKRFKNTDWKSTESSTTDNVDSMENHEDEEVDYDLDSNGDVIKKTGMNWFVTGLCVVGNQAGGGIVALPTAVIESQFYFGIILLVLMGFGLGYTGYCLGQCWVLLQRMYPEYRKSCRRPYATIGYRAMGTIVRKIVSVFLCFNLFGTCVVFLLLASKNIHDFMKAFISSFDVSYCIIVLFVALFLLPLTFLKSPEDFWWTIVISMIATGTATIFIIVGSITDYDTCEKYRELPDFKITNYFLAFATMTFAYAGHSSFPTLQFDMKRPKEFTKANIMGFTIVVLLYIPVCLVGYLSYGDSLRDSVINSIQLKWIQQTINICITLHLIFALTITINPLNQEIEEYFGIPHKFSSKRILIRFSVMLAVVFVAESIPTFGPVLDLVGGSSQTFTAIVFPVLFYVFIWAKAKVKEEYRAINKTEWDGIPTIKQVFKHCPPWLLISCGIIIVIGVIGAATATYSAILEITTTQFQEPCYVSAFKKGKSANDDKHTNCCGHNQTINRYNDISRCSDPDLGYYT